MANLKVSDAVTTEDKFEEIYRNIGNHFINNAERLAKNVVDSTTNVDIFIKLEPNSVVTIDISQSEILRRQEVSVFQNTDISDTIDRIVENMEKKMEELKNV
ncbi:hypothetical protein [Lysinibacillus capsici]|uniref:hypothetical protein n=1 Tax=Lysinibacillus capsici TaxID=2115968 RepID=UPI0028B1505B|nr:hypothetical protein [Lysinibacillus capsici]